MKNISRNRNWKKYCQYHGTCGLSTNRCTLVKALVQKEKKKKQKAIKERKYTKHEVNILVERKMQNVLKKEEEAACRRTTGF